MSLPTHLVSEFAKITSDKTKVKGETTVYGEAVEYSGSMYVKLDGSDRLTPCKSTIEVKPGDRVMVVIKNHTATINGSTTSPSASKDTVDKNKEEVEGKIDEFDVIIANKVDTEDLTAVNGRIDNLVSDNIVVNEKLTANEAEIKKLDVEKLSVDDAEIKYANIDFSNIGKVTMEYFYAQSGLIKDVTIGDATITGELVGVTIKGDLIEGNTIVADKLVIKGTDGLYYKLNTDGITTEAEQTDYNSLNGQVIRAKSVTAEKISVEDLVAFDATIGGFNLSPTSLYSGVKESVENTTRGIYMDNDGQFSFGDSTNYIKYYLTDSGKSTLEMSLDTLNIFGKGNITDIVDEVKNSVDKMTDSVDGMQETVTDVNNKVDGQQEDIDEAKKVATNFLGFDSNDGLVVGDNRYGTLRKNVRIDGTNVDIRNGSRVLARFAASLIELGKGDANAIVKFCDDLGQIGRVSKDGYDCLSIESDLVQMSATREASVEASNARLMCTSYAQGDEVTILANGNDLVSVSLLSPRSLSGSLVLMAAGNEMSMQSGATTFAKPVTISSGGITINRCEELLKNNVLWSGYYWPDNNQQCDFTGGQKVSEQPHGIVLVFSYYANGTYNNSQFHSFFIPKHQVSKHPSGGARFVMVESNFSTFCQKYLYIADTFVKGHATNKGAGTSASGVKYNNNNFVIRYVIGV